jgi:hypothetical protein
MRDLPGARIIQFSWASVILFSLVAIVDAVGVPIDALAVGLCLVLFVVSLPIWAWAFGLAVVRTGRGDDIVVSSLFFLTGSAPDRVRRHLLGAFGVSIVVALATAWANPFGVLVPMLPLGLVGLWGARHGVFPARRQ